MRVFKAQSLLQGLVVFTLLVSVAGLTVLAVDVSRSYQLSTSKQEIKLIANALNISVANELLSGNMFVAQERIRAMTARATQNQVCVRILDPHLQPLFSSGPEKLCQQTAHDSQEVLRFLEPVYFDDQNSEVAYTIEVLSQAREVAPFFVQLLKFEGSESILIVGLFASLALLLFAVGQLQRFTFHEINKLLTSHNEHRSPVLLGLFEIEELQKVYNSQRQLKEAIQLAAQANLADQVAHDIRSPLAALEAAASKLQNAADPKAALRIIAGGVERIRGIVRDLGAEQRSLPGTQWPSSVATAAAASGEIVLLAPVVLEVIQEKLVQTQVSQDYDIQSDLSTDAFQSAVFCHRSDLARVVSNVINNSIDARIEGRPLSIKVVLSKTSKDAVIEISDNGRGIPKSVIPKLFIRHATFGKSNGRGLGLAYARERLTQWKGSIDLQSVENQGTTVTIRIPLGTRPEVFAPNVDLRGRKTIWVVDDDPLIFEVWRQRVRSEMTYFARPDDIEALLDKADFILLDHEFNNSTTTGLDFAIHHKIDSNKFILVTGRGESPELHDQLYKHRMRCVPKSALSFIGIFE